MGWSLVAQKKECDNLDKPEIDKGRLQSVAACASKCAGEASMFIFGTNDFLNPKCTIDGCKCFCETMATNQGTCNTADNTGYRLYKYTPGDQLTLYNKISLMNHLVIKCQASKWFGKESNICIVTKVYSHCNHTNNLILNITKQI